MRSSIIPILGLPLGLLFSILPSSTSFNNPSPLMTCPIQFFFRLTIVSTILLLSTTASSTSSLLILSSQLTFSNLLQTHISNASNLSIDDDDDDDDDDDLMVSIVFRLSGTLTVWYKNWNKYCS